MQYVASKNLIHRNLAARNILLCQNNVAKISDFGLCCTGDDSFIYQASLTKKLPIKWLSIEALTEHIFSEKSDVWSFGVLIYEVYTFGQIPYPTMSNEEMVEFLKSGQRLECPDGMSDDLYEIMRRCWMAMTEERPDFSQLEQDFHVLIEDITKNYGYLLS
jgi:serine/threonine protein kinase